ncbi:methyl-accepting chemotaxis protein [Nocardioides aquiterrae]|uniref:Methyl-accepting chemotaxis protein n=1 Tax=Nocardioides aquiterrae TaxID=203799 RepID=A0ABN1UCS1_9ACTN
MASPSPTPASSARSRVGVRGKILIVGAVGIVAALLVGVIGVSNAREAKTTATQLHALQQLVSDVKEVNFYNADISGWQVAYAWDVRRLSPAEAVDPNSPNRAGFLADCEKLKQLLGSMSTEAMTAGEARAFEEIRGLWEDFDKVDARVVKAYLVGTPTSVEQGDALILNQGYGIYFKIIDLTNQLIDSVMKRTASATDGAEASAAAAERLVIVVLILGALAVAAAALYISRRIVAGIAAVQRALTAFAAGDLTATAPVTSNDEVGQMARTYDEARRSVAGIVTKVAASADAVAAASEELSAASQQIAAGAEETSVQAGVVSGAAEEVSRNVQTVAAGAEQMGASIREISQSANDAAKVASEAVSTVDSTNETVAKLGLSSNEIGNVVKVITSIAEQTNLLALNATIEAARAGEAGKGFAVVANEVKELAQETARATDDIARRVEAIQADTGGAVEAINEIATIITAINDYQLTIASAVEEQTATTNEMSRNVVDASTGSGEIATNISGVAAAAETTTQAVNQTLAAIGELASMAAGLRAEVSTFQLEQVR